MEQQSKELSLDLTKRAEEYLAKMSTESVLLISDDSDTINVVHQEAIHLWAARSTNRELILSYDQMQRIKQQFETFSTKLQWTLDVGDCWILQRNGRALSITQRKGTNCEEPIEQATGNEASLSWDILSMNDLPINLDLSKETSYNLNFGNLPPATNVSEMTIKQVKDVNSLTFTPPWRKGRSAVKIKEFLRGQKVPLHCRDDSLVLCCSNGPLDSVLAIYLEEKDTWIIHADFVHEKGDAVTVILKRI